MRPVAMLVAAVMVYAPAGFAENAEFFAFGGGSFTTKKTISGAAGDADAGLKSGISAGAAFGHNMYEYIGGEVRYTFQKHDMKLEAGGTSTSFGAQSHTLHYDLLFHTAPRSASVRPYVAAGGGVKMFRGTGTESVAQPLWQYAILTKTDQTVGMASVGAGIKWRVNDWLLFRADVHNYMSPFPSEVIAPVPGAKVSGWVHNIVPSAGLSFVF